MAHIGSREELAQALKQVLFKQRAVLFLAGVATLLAAAIGITLLLSFIATLFVLPVAVKMSLLVLSLGALGFFVFKYIRSAFSYGSIDAVAVALEQKYPSLKGVLIAAVQFSRMGNQSGFSDELVRMTEQVALKETGEIKFDEVVPFAPLRKSGRTFGLAAIAATLLVVIAPGLFTRGYEVFSDPLTKVAPPLGYQVVAFPGNTQWIKFRDITIGAAISGDNFPQTASIYHRFAGGSWQKTDVDLRNLQKALSQHGDSIAPSFTLRQVSRSFDYYIEAGDITTEVQSVDVVDRPRVTGIKLSVFPPAYTKLPPTVIDENNGSFSAVVGSRVTARVETNAPMKTASLQFADATVGALPLNITDRYAEGNLIVDKTQSYHIMLTDALGEANPDPIEYYITAIPDEYPSVEALYPGYDVNLNVDMMLPLQVRIFDDFGFSSLVLKFQTMSQGRLSEEHVAVLHYSESVKTEGDVEFNWNLESIGLKPGDYVGYYFEVADNDAINGPKISRTRQFIARLPSLEEVLSQTEEESTNRVQKTEDFFNQAKDVNQRLQAAARKMQAEAKSQGAKEWEDKKELEAIVDKNSELFDNIEKMAEEMNKSIDNMQDNALLSREIMEKMAQIQKLFEDVATPEMKDAQKELMEALKSMDPKDIKKAMEEYSLSQKEMLERLERTLALLKKMQVEQKMEAMMRKMEELVEKQENANKATDEAKEKAQLSPLSKKADENKESLEQLKKEVSELEQMMKEAKMEQDKEAQKFADALKETDADKNLEQMSDALKKQEKNSASEQGKEAKKKMMNMLGQMQSSLASMKGQNSEEFAKKMKNTIQDANQLSQNQEDLMQEAAMMNATSTALRDMTHQQLDLAEASASLQAQIDELGKSSPFVAAELQSLVKEAIQGMKAAAEGLEGTRGSQATMNQRDAMASLNKASQRLMESMNQQKQCNNGGSCDKNVSQLESLSQKQQQLNQKTQGQCNNPGGSNPKPGSSGAAGREAMERMAGEQSAIRKSLEDLNDEFGGSRQILGRLDDIAKEMKEVEEALESGNVGQETLDRQLNIYSRMLEASRSLQRKDFTEQRRAATAQNVAPFVPPAFSSDVLNDKANIEDRLREFLSGNYPPQYKEQVKAYFRTLLEAESGAHTIQPQTQPNE